MFILLISIMAVNIGVINGLRTQIHSLDFEELLKNC